MKPSGGASGHEVDEEKADQSGEGGIGDDSDHYDHDSEKKDKAASLDGMDKEVWRSYKTIGYCYGSNQTWHNGELAFRCAEYQGIV